MKRSFDSLANDEKQKIINADFYTSIVDKNVDVPYRKDALNYFFLEKSILDHNVSLLESNLKTTDFGVEKLVVNLTQSHILDIRVTLKDVMLSLGKYDVNFHIYIKKHLLEIETVIYNITEIPAQKLYYNPKVNEILSNIKTIIKKFLIILVNKENVREITGQVINTPEGTNEMDYEYKILDKDGIKSIHNLKTILDNTCQNLMDTEYIDEILEDFFAAPDEKYRFIFQLKKELNNTKIISGFTIIEEFSTTYEIILFCSLKGNGKYLMNYVKSILCTNGCHIYLHSVEEAKTFYEKNGFKFDKEHKHYVYIKGGKIRESFKPQKQKSKRKSRKSRKHKSKRKSRKSPSKSSRKYKHNK